MNKKIASLFASVGFDIDTTDLTIEEAVERLAALIKNKM